MTERSCLCIILAAGEGTRMKSALPKVLHKVAHLPLVAHVARAAVAAGVTQVALVTGRGSEEVQAAVADHVPVVTSFEQHERLGTAHAALAARTAIEAEHDDVLIVFGDTPLVEADSLGRARAALADGAAVAVMGFRTDRPQGYGRLIEEAGQLVAIREDRDCSPEELAITFCNGGLMAVSGEHLLSLLDRVDDDNSKGEYYLTDIVGLAHADGLKVVAVDVPADSVLGINNRAELAEAEAIWQARARHRLLLDGVTMQAPDTVHLAWDTEIGADTVIEPNVVFGPGVEVEGGATIHAFSHLEGAFVASGAQVGPFARLRPGADLGENSKVGNFCEVKNARIEPGAKVNHLSYIGDALIGAKANIGAGTITCNYDGFRKHPTEIGEGAFIGSNSALVAPIRIGAGAYVASGSVVTHDVPDDAVAFGRARQEVKEGRAKVLRARLSDRQEG